MFSITTRTARISRWRICHRLLGNVAYLGKVKYKDEVHAGEHEAIVHPDIFEQVQSLLQKNHRTGGAEVRNQFGALLKGLLRCVPCNMSMTPSSSKKNGATQYRYYVCLCAQKLGWKACPSKSVPATEVERFVVDQIRCIGEDPTLIAETLTQARAQGESKIAELEAELAALEHDLGRYDAEMRDLVLQPGQSGDRMSARLADLNERITLGEQRLAVIRDEFASLQNQIVGDQDVKQALSQFEPVWEQLSPRERARVLQLLIERVDYDGRTGEISITFHLTGIKTLADQLAAEQEDAA